MDVYTGLPAWSGLLLLAGMLPCMLLKINSGSPVLSSLQLLEASMVPIQILKIRSCSIKRSVPACPDSLLRLSAMRSSDLVCLLTFYTGLHCYLARG